MTQQGSLALERGVGAGIVASATYLVNIDRQLPGSVDINIAPATGTKTFRLQGGTSTPGVPTASGPIMPTGTMLSASAMVVFAAMAINGLKLRAVSVYSRFP